MNKAAIINTRIEPSLKADAEIILQEVGLTSAEAVRLFYKQICLHRGLPFRVEMPNQLTRKTLSNSAEGVNVKRFDSMEDFFNELEQ